MATPSPLVGQTISHYRILEKLGGGGMGVVYKAEDTELRRLVALKFLPDELAQGPQALERFRREARAASALNHPNVCTIYEVGEAADVAYIVMEYVAGRTLTELKGAHGLPAREVIRYAIQIADALAHAHGHGVVHRDLKSDNIIVTEDGRTKILDFGLAKRLSASVPEQSTLSHSAMSDQKLAGTLPYMAPEILRDQTTDIRVDIWALGVVLYEIASGTRPFQGETAFELTSAILKELPPALSNDTPAGLRSVIQRCLEKEPVRRYQRASEVRAALEIIECRPTHLHSKQTRKAIDSLAVLPFLNVSGDSDTEYLCDGITEAIINGLSQMPKLRVIPRSTTFRYKKREVDLQVVGNELNVRAVLGGRVLQRGEKLIIGTELVDVAKQSQLWGQQYSRKIADILAIQDDIAGEISEKLRLQLSHKDREKLLKRHTDNSEAYQLYLKGRYFLNQRTADAFQRAIQALQEAIGNDSHYALAYAGLADAHLLTAWWESVPTDRAIQQVREAANKALEIDPSLAEVHTALGLAKFTHDWDWEGGLREMQRATEANPRYTQGHYWYGFALCALGRMTEGRECVRRAYALEPLNLLADTFYAVIPDFFERRFARVIDSLNRLAEMDPNLPNTAFFRALALLSADRMEEAVAEAERGAALCGRLPLMTGVLGLAYGSAGYHDRARLVLSEIQTRPGYVPPLPLALTYAGLGRTSDAFYWLEKAVQERSLWIAWLAVDSRFDLFRSDLRYFPILKRVGLPT